MPSSTSPRAPIVLISPAMAVPAAFYRPLVAAFEVVGWDASALGRRGFGAGPRASRSEDWSYADEVADIAAEVARAREKAPERSVVLLGHSLGAQLCAAYQISRTPAEGPADGFVAIGASTPHFRRYPYAGLPVLAAGLTIPVLTRVAGFVPRPMFGAPGARTLMGEWAGWVRTGRPPFAVPGPVLSPTLVVKLQADAYAVSAATDDFVALFCDPSLTTRWTYTRDLTPPGGVTDHLRWVKQPAVVVDRVVAWWGSLPALDLGLGGVL